MLLFLYINIYCFLSVSLVYIKLLLVILIALFYSLVLCNM